LHKALFFCLGPMLGPSRHRSERFRPWQGQVQKIIWRSGCGCGCRSSATFLSVKVAPTANGGPPTPGPRHLTKLSQRGVQTRKATEPTIRRWSTGPKNDDTARAGRGSGGAVCLFPGRWTLRGDAYVPSLVVCSRRPGGGRMARPRKITPGLRALGLRFGFSCIHLCLPVMGGRSRLAMYCEGAAVS
jgi:hypothetical protein